jgi:hypothetical protein
MDIAALIAWVVTALGGFVLLFKWVSAGGHKPTTEPRSRLSPAQVFGHFLLAATGLVLWLVYVASDTDGVAWPAFAIVVIVALIVILAYYLIKIAGLLEHILEGLQTTNNTVLEIIGHAEPIIPGVERINRTLGVIAGALPLLYNLAEKIDNKLAKT